MLSVVGLVSGLGSHPPVQYFEVCVILSRDIRINIMLSVVGLVSHPLI